jgi:hypothetical protein
VAGRIDGPDVAGSVDNLLSFALEYRGETGSDAPDRWYIPAQGAGTPLFPTRARFKAIIDGAKDNRSRAPSVERVFADGFEGCRGWIRSPRHKETQESPSGLAQDPQARTDARGLVTSPGPIDRRVRSCDRQLPPASPRAATTASI